ncbi:MAG: hypothetical protein P9M07_04375 [Candidatus Aceula meridiana]|nr:hypothetical protein [Candidatus Aceula meridiana]
MTKVKVKTPKYYLDNDSRFIIENYNTAKPFTNFFPGIAGVWGIPMWVFYVNRGQCISSFGIESKDKAIMEFQPANKAYRYTAAQGFRTFIKVKKGKKVSFYEPFKDSIANQVYKRHNKMAMTAHDLTIEETNETLGIVVRVNYATLPEEQYAALIRKVTVENISAANYQFEVLDGMPSIVPYGFNDRLLKDLSRTVEAWIQVSNLEKKAPYYNLKVIVSDKPYVENIDEGNFYFSFLNHKTKPKLLEPIVQPKCIFGQSKDFDYPKNFLAQENFKVPAKQKTNNKTPSAMSFAKFSLKKGEATTITSMVGHIHSKPQLNRIVRKSVLGEYVQKKMHRNEEIINELKNYVLTNSESRELNLYSMQTFVDNVLRGGLPISLKTDIGTSVLNVFSRKHGDPERDYNYFVLDPTFLSQGNGNYRDVNQNRRNDVWFNRDLKDGSIVDFLNLTQADGYNPLVVRGTAFYFRDSKKAEKLIKQYVQCEDVAFVRNLLKGDFFPGRVLKTIFEEDIHLKTPPDSFLMKILALCHERELADHGEGFWTDHWTYNLDLIESYLNVYPDQLRQLLLKKKVFSFYHNDHYVLPRRNRYILTERGPRQYHSVAKMPEEMLLHKKDDKLRMKKGKKSVYQTTLIAKLLCLVSNKAASLDPSGVGVEMEANKPNWYDALNGLPGLLGSSLSETLELKRFCLFLSDSLNTLGVDDNDSILLFEELAEFVRKLYDVLRDEPYSLSYWEKSNEIKERYRLSVLTGLTGKEKKISILEIKKFLSLVIKRTDKSVRLAKGKKGMATYFFHEITHYKKLNRISAQGLPFVAPLGFKRHNLPLFLEGFVHALRVEKDKKQAQEIYQKVRRSALFDKKLKMYRVNTDLSKETSEIGRARVFPAGWLENQSIWLHMEYKFLLETLRCGLYEEFHEDLSKTAVPFLNAEKYGRSILENSSFIVSSAHEDPHQHGRGYVARLSGSTAEFVHIWLLMNAGLRPFVVDAKGALALQFQPVLKGSFFTTQPTTIRYFNKNQKWQNINFLKDTYAFNFMGSTLVVYHNPKRRDTYKIKIKEIVLTYLKPKKKIKINAEVIPAPHANAVRDNQVERIDVFF